VFCHKYCDKSRTKIVTKCQNLNFRPLKLSQNIYNQKTVIRGGSMTHGNAVEAAVQVFKTSSSPLLNSPIVPDRKGGQLWVVNFSKAFSGSHDCCSLFSTSECPS
jgi:hypothetical protein